MPVEIRELVIQAKANTASGQEANPKSKTTHSKASSAGGQAVVGKITHDLRRQLVEDCVLEVMDLMQKNRMI